MRELTERYATQAQWVEPLFGWLWTHEGGPGESYVPDAGLP